MNRMKESTVANIDFGPDGNIRERISRIDYRREKESKADSNPKAVANFKGGDDVSETWSIEIPSNIPDVFERYIRWAEKNIGSTVHLEKKTVIGSGEKGRAITEMRIEGHSGLEDRSVGAHAFLNGLDTMLLRQYDTLLIVSDSCTHKDFKFDHNERIKVLFP